jgi:tetratricopeptide (TPR) repeat protein
MLFRRFIAAVRAAHAKSLRERRVQRLLDRGESLMKTGEVDRAELCYAEALAIDDSDREARSRMALLLTGSGRMEQALPHYRAAHAAEPLAGAAVESYVRVLLQSGGTDEATIVAEAAVAMHPSSYESWLALGLAAIARHDYRRAITALDRALDLRSDSPDAHANRGIALQNIGRFAEAHSAYDRALQAQPGNALARFHRSLAWLVNGEYARGWPEYETRLLDAALARRPQHFPRWDGSAPVGRKMLVYGEQGLGDEIMFASCLPDLVRAGGRCVIECNPALRALFARSFPEATVYAALPGKEVPESIRAPGIDFEVPLGSLPFYFRRSAQAFPREGGYMKADPERAAAWRVRLATLGRGFTVGISWQGGTQATRAALRSIPLHEWLPILKIPGVRFVSLQYTPDASRALDTLWQQQGIRVAHWPEAIADYDETAALVCALDLTVSVCTSVVHLAGALGRPVWVMVPRNPEWRYGYAGDTMPWYPSVRLFRQEQESDWAKVISSVERQLLEHIASSTASSVRAP